MVVKTLKNLSVPEEKECIFTKPDFENWPSLLRKNKNSLSGVNNRESCRSELINNAADYTRRMGLPVPELKTEQDIIVTGHQPNWHHCGIFAKNIITDRFARQTTGTAVQLVLDHDIFNTSMILTESNNNALQLFKTIPLEQKQNDIPIESRPIPSKEQLRKFIDSVSKVSKNSLCSEIWCWNLNRIIGNTHSCKNIADIITQMQAQLNYTLDLDIIYLPVSLMSQTNSFIDFVCSVIFDPVGFVDVYNRAVKNKRLIENLKPKQTVRALKTDYLNNIVELPFWLVSQTHKRKSLYASLDDINVRIGTSENVVGTINYSRDKKQQLLEILRKNKCAIRPKAVILTLFARIYLADLFVHGVGAANYEYITDLLINDYYRIPNMDYGVATATMTLPADADYRNPEIAKNILNYRKFFFGLFQKEKLEKLIHSQKGQK